MTTHITKILEYMYNNKNEWLLLRNIIKNISDLISPKSIAPIITQLYHTGALERKQVNGFYVYKISKQGIDILSDSITKPKRLYRSLTSIPDATSKILKILESGTYFSALEITQKLNLRDHHAGGVGTRLAMMCIEGLVTKKQIDSVNCYKITENNNELTPPNTIIKMHDLEQRVRELMNYGVTRLEIQKICYNALQPKIDEVVNDKINDELKYLKENDFTILDKYTNMKNEIEDLKEKLHKSEIKEMVNRQKSDRLLLNDINK